jgi:hypothetical protein
VHPARADDQVWALGVGEVEDEGREVGVVGGAGGGEGVGMPGFVGQQVVVGCGYGRGGGRRADEAVGGFAAVEGLLLVFGFAFV